MSGKIYFNQFPATGVAMHNRYGARLDFEMFGQRLDDRFIGASIFCRRANFDNDGSIRSRCNAGFLRARDNFHRKAHQHSSVVVVVDVGENVVAPLNAS